MFRDPYVSFGFDSPSNCLGLRSFLLDGWNFLSGVLANWGIRILGFRLELEWHWMSPAQEEFWMEQREHCYPGGQQFQSEVSRFYGDLLGGRDTEEK